MSTVRLTMAQALVRYLCNQFTIIDGKREPLFAGLFGIFGHGNVTCLSEALEAVQDTLPTWRGQNEQSMALAAVGYAKAMRRRQIMIALSSIGPGALNMVTAAGCAHANRLPILILAGDIFANRRPDPVLQQVEHFGNPTTSVNDAFKAVTRYWDRITHPEQIISSLPQAIATMLDPGDCGPAFIGLCQDTQEIAFDYPEAFFTPTVHTIPRPRPDKDRVAAAIELIKSAKRPLIISGGGVRYSGAEKEVSDFALKHGIPMAETIAGKGAVTHDHPAHVGPIGVIGSSSANEMAGAADVIIAIGTRLQDFTTGSWTVFSHDAKFVSINAARYDAVKHRALSVVGDARETVTEIAAAMSGWKADASWTSKGKTAFKAWNDLLDKHQKPTNEAVPTYAHVVGMVNKWAAPNDTMVTAAGGLPGETAKGWSIKNPNTYDLEFGFSAMGYEIAGGWGHAMAKKGDGETIVMVGDGVLPDDELRHLFDRADGPQDDRRRLRQWRIRGHQPAAELQGHAVLQQPDQGQPREAALRGGLRQARRIHGSSGAALPEPCRPRGSTRLGEDHRPHDRHLDRDRRLRMGAGRCGLGRRRAGGFGSPRGERRARAPRYNPQEATHRSLRP